MKEQEGGLRLELIVSPRASRSQIKGLHDGRLKVQLAAAPVDGEANEELIDFLAETFNLPKKSISLIQGHTSKRKSLYLASARLSDLQQILGKHLKIPF